MLNKIPGVSDVKVDYDTKTASCKVPEVMDVEKVAKAISGRFSAKVKS